MQAGKLPASRIIVAGKQKYSQKFGLRSASVDSIIVSFTEQPREVFYSSQGVVQER